LAAVELGHLVGGCERPGLATTGKIIGEHILNPAVDYTHPPPQRPTPPHRRRPNPRPNPILMLINDLDIRIIHVPLVSMMSRRTRARGW
jgi:hypothetical protein